MTDEQKKELFSRVYIRAVASAAGYKVGEPAVDDDSIDITISSSGANDTPKRPQVEAQLKCTCRDVMHEDGVHFELPLKNYNDLRAEVLVPRILVVVLVPENISGWLIQNDEDMLLKHRGYWLSLAGKEPTSNSSSVTITIPKNQVLDVETLKTMMQKINNGQSL